MERISRPDKKNKRPYNKEPSQCHSLEENHVPLVPEPPSYGGNIPYPCFEGFPVPVPFFPPNIKNTESENKKGNEYAQGFYSHMFPPMPIFIPHPDVDADNSNRKKKIRRNHSCNQDIAKPCRILFVRNTPYDIDEKTVYDLFVTKGEIKHISLQIKDKGIVFVTFYDIRSSKKAKEELQGAPLGGRKIEIQFSISKMIGEDRSVCDENKNQGTLYIRCLNVTEMVSNDDIRSLVSKHGELKEIRNLRGKKNIFFVEFFDSRACVNAFEVLKEKPFLDGRLRVEFSWDYPVNSTSTPPTKEQDTQKMLNKQKRKEKQKTQRESSAIEEKKTEFNINESIEKAVSDPRLVNRVERLFSLFEQKPEKETNKEKTV